MYRDSTSNTFDSAYSVFIFNTCEFAAFKICQQLISLYCNWFECKGENLFVWKYFFFSCFNLYILENDLLNCYHKKALNILYRIFFVEKMFKVMTVAKESALFGKLLQKTVKMFLQIARKQCHRNTVIQTCYINNISIERHWGMRQHQNHI